MARISNNVQDLSNQDLFLLKKPGKSETDIIITIRNKKYQLKGKVEATITKSGNLTYLALPSVYCIFDGLTPIEKKDTAPAIKALKYPKGGKRKGAIEVPPELLAQLEEFNRSNNARIISTPGGGFKVARVRGPRKKKS